VESSASKEDFVSRSVSRSPSSRRSLEFTSLAFFLTSASRFAMSSRSFSRVVIREFSVDSRACQFSEARAYWVCKVSTWRRSFVEDSEEVVEDVSSDFERRSSRRASRSCERHVSFALD